MNNIQEEILADAREKAARQVYRYIMTLDRPDIAVAVILETLDAWYEKGVLNGILRGE